MNSENETHSTKEKEPIAEEMKPLKEIMKPLEEIPLPKFKLSCSPKGTIWERLLMEKTLTGLYVHLCSDCRQRVRSAIVELSLANAEKIFNDLDINRAILPPSEVWE